MYKPPESSPSHPSSLFEEGAYPAIHSGDHTYQFLNSGAVATDAVEALIANAQQSICFEMYIYRSDDTGNRIREALLNAVRRGVRTRILLDDFGSAELPKDFFAELLASGAQLRFFNPSRVMRVAFRNHRKLIIGDEREAIVGGFNVGNEYAGDGVTTGWRDLGLQVSGPIVQQLLLSFARMFVAARMDYSSYMAFSRHIRPDPPTLHQPSLLTSGPGVGGPFLRRSLYQDIRRAKAIDIVAAYFAPTWVMRKRLSKASRHCQMRLILPMKSDVPILRSAGQHLYSRFLRDGVRIYEYEPQILHAKLFVIDDIVYVGSCNLDVRSLRLNYELLLRIPDAALAAQARQLIETDILHSQAVEPESWRRNTHWWQTAERRIAYWLVNRLDPFLARRRLRASK